MVRRRLLSNSAKQASMSAYQHFWQQQQQPHPQSTLIASMPQYWQSMCSQLGGAVPRLAVMAPAEASSRRVTRVRRQLVKVPRETATNYVQQQVPLQRGYQAMWDRCCMNQGALLKPGAFLPGFQRGPMTQQQHPQQRSFHYQQENHPFSYPAAVQMHQEQWQQQQHHQPVPVGILKKTSQMDASGLHNPKRVTIRSPSMVRRRFQVPSVEQVKPPKPVVPPKPRRTRQQLLKREQQKLLQHQLLCQRELQRQQQFQKDLHKQQEHQKELQKQREAQKELQKLQERQEKLRKQQELEKELLRQREQRQEELLKRQQLYKEILKKQELQKKLLEKQELQKKLIEKQEIQKNISKKQELEKHILKNKELQNELLKKQEHQKQLQKQQELQKEHQLELEKMQQQLQQRKLKQEQLGKVQEQQELLEKSNNFNFGKFASSFLDNCTWISESETGIPPTKAFNKNFIYEGTPENGDNTEDSRGQGKPYSPRFQPSDLGSKSSTITLTTEQSHFDFEPPRTPCQSQATLTDKATNTQIDPLGELLKHGHQRATSKGSRKLNINELLRSEETKGLKADPMWHSLMQLVAQMCESQEQDDKSRLRAGSGADEGRQKQYSVYLMVTSDEEEDESASSPNTEVESSRMTSDERIPAADEYTKRCGHMYQEEHPRLGRRKRTRKRLNPRLADLAYPYSNPPPLLPMRRPLHWPKQDLSKPSQGRANRSRTPSRVRSRSSTKHIAQVLNQSSLSSVLDPKRSWRLWEDLPMTARTLNKAYSRLLTRSGGTTSCTEL